MTELERQYRAELCTALMVLGLIREQARNAQCGPESAVPITPENGEKLRATLMQIQAKADNALVALRADAR